MLNKVSVVQCFELNFIEVKIFKFQILPLSLNGVGLNVLKDL